MYLAPAWYLMPMSAAPYTRRCCEITALVEVRGGMGVAGTLLGPHTALSAEQCQPDSQQPLKRASHFTTAWHL